MARNVFRIRLVRILRFAKQMTVLLRPSLKGFLVSDLNDEIEMFYSSTSIHYSTFLKYKSNLVDLCEYPWFCPIDLWFISINKKSISFWMKSNGKIDYRSIRGRKIKKHASTLQALQKKTAINHISDVRKKN